MTIAIIDYGAGNLRSAQKAFQIAARNIGLSNAVELVTKPEEIASADWIILPGDGAFRDCRQALAAEQGMEEAINEAIHKCARPFMGICVGMQLLATYGTEIERTDGLDWINGRVEKISPDDPKFKVPHMGWNTLLPTQKHSIFEGLELGKQGNHAYFLHAYHFHPSDEKNVLAKADYSGDVTAIIAHNNILGLQFHPEKSSHFGIALLENFLRWRP